MLDNRIKKLRLDMDLTMKELASKLSVSESVISLYESGKRQPSYDILFKLSDIFNVSVDYMLGRTDDKRINPLDKELEGVDFALWGEVKELTDEQKKDILDYIRFKKQRSE